MNGRVALARLQGGRDSEQSSGESAEEGSSGDTGVEEEVDGDSANVTSDDDDDELEEKKDAAGAIANERPRTAAAVNPDRLAAFRGLLLRGISVELCDTHGYRHSRPVLAARRLKQWIATRRGAKRLHNIRMKQIRLLGTRVADTLADALARARENARMARTLKLNAHKHAMWLAKNAKKHATNVGLHAMAAGRRVSTSLTMLSAEDRAALRAHARLHKKMHWKRRTFFLRHGPRGAELRYVRPPVLLLTCHIQGSSRVCTRGTSSHAILPTHVTQSTPFLLASYVHSQMAKTGEICPEAVSSSHCSTCRCAQRRSREH